MKNKLMEKDAIFSKCGKYRYELSRYWDRELPTMMVVGLNPSTADENYDDPTIRRCIGFAKAWGYGGIRMTNLFAWRATSPKAMLAQDNPIDDSIGEINNWYIGKCAVDCKMILACWGIHGSHNNRDKDVLALLCRVADRTVHCLAINKDGSPKHPLYVKGDVRPGLYAAF